jgi:hypothetical protein
MSDHVATTYGLQRDSILNTSKFFHVTEGLPMDIMHDILEGSLQYETKLLLHHIISNGILSLDDINSAIQSFDYGFVDMNNKPSLINHLSLDTNALKQSGVLSTLTTSISFC